MLIADKNMVPTGNEEMEDSLAVWNTNQACLAHKERLLLHVHRVWDPP